MFSVKASKVCKWDTLYVYPLFLAINKGLIKHRPNVTSEGPMPQKIYFTLSVFYVIGWEGSVLTALAAKFLTRLRRPLLQNGFIYLSLEV